MSGVLHGAVAAARSSVAVDFVISYSLGAAGAGGYNTANGGTGGTTTVTFGDQTLVAYGGQGGFYNADTNASGGTGSGGNATGTTGGKGGYSSGDYGGGGGGGIGGAAGANKSSGQGRDGAQSHSEVLKDAVTAAGGTWTGPGAGGTNVGDNISNGGNATGFGCGGGGANYYGGNGGNGLYGGGGGGAAGYYGLQTGGAGGGGAVVLTYTSGGTNYSEILTSGSSYTVPAGATLDKLWAVGAGGGGAGATNSDATSGGGGGAGGFSVWINGGISLLTTNTYSQTSVYNIAAIQAATWEYMNNSNADGLSNSNQTATQQYTGADNGRQYVKTALFGALYVDHIVIGYDYHGNLPGGWGVGYTEGCLIEGSTDNSTWTTIATTPTYESTGSTNGLVTIPIAGTWNYLRISKDTDMCLLEFQVWTATREPQDFQSDTDPTPVTASLDATAGVGQPISATTAVTASPTATASVTTPVTLVGTPNSAAGTTVTIPTHAVGDIIVIFAYRDGNNTIPSKPAASGTVPAWSDIDAANGANTTSSRTAYFIATATNHTSGTWTSATGMVAAVLRGQAASPIGGKATGGGTSSTSAVAPAVTLSNATGASALLHFLGHRTVTAWSTAPSGYTLRTSVATEVAMLTKNDTTSDGAVTQSLTASASSGYRGTTVEILPTTT